MKQVLLIFIILLILTGCSDQSKVSLEKEVETVRDMKYEGVWRSVDSRIAFEFTSNAKADFYNSSGEGIFAATYSKVNNKVKFEFNAFADKIVKNFIIHDGYLEDEETGNIFYPEDGFLRQFINFELLNARCIILPTPDERFAIHPLKSKDQHHKNWSQREFGKWYLDSLIDYKEQSIVSKVEYIDNKDGLDRYIYTLKSDIAELPRRRELHEAVIGISLGESNVLDFKQVNIKDSEFKFFEGTYKFEENILAKRMYPNERSQKIAKFRIKIKPARSITKQPKFEAIDYTIDDKHGYVTDYIKELIKK